MAVLHDQPYILSSFLTHFPHLVNIHGGDLVAICQSAGLTPEEITPPHRLIPFDRFIELLETSATSLHCPDFSLRLAALQDLSIMGPVAAMLQSCNTVGEAMDVVARELPLFVWGLELTIKRDADRLAFTYAVSLPNLVQRKQFQDYLLGSSTTIIRQIAGADVPLRGVYFSRAIPHYERLVGYEEFFKAPIAFGGNAPHLTVDPNILGRRPKLPPQETRYGRISELAGGLRRQVSDSLAVALPSGKIGIGDVASGMGCSERTLRRHLASHKLSFSMLRDELRYKMANNYLHSTCYSLGDIATLLGFANQSAFSRSYRRWSGQTPREFRTALSKAPV